MAKLSINSKKNNGIYVVVEKLQKSVLLSKMSSRRNIQFEHAKGVPKDVKEGHFPVIAVDGHEKKRFVVPIAYLRHPLFVGLLERAAEEYGFNHEGVVMVPCRPSELEVLLYEQRMEGQRGCRDNVHWSSCKTLVDGR